MNTLIDAEGVEYTGVQTTVISPRAQEELARMRDWSLLSVREAAAMAGTSQTSVRRALRSGRMAGVKRGHRWITDVLAVKEWIA